jgi:two-component system nitrogen regulation sensor histidine kinase NtrY
MVRRLRRARRALVRTTRRTQAIVEDAATGVIALDAQGRVALVNPRAESLLGREVPLGEPLADGDDPASELVRGVGLYFRDRLREATSEFQFDDRRIRVRARRITRAEGALGGAVLSLEDVTDELRSERILAWGEMARQVAHEVKNPLTPIRLSIQHIQRAHADGRPDFDEILSKNAEAMIKEIDRLAAIATSFSRFGAPSEAGAVPLEPVRVGAVVKEVLALYATDEGPIRFEGEIPPDLPSVHARESEMKEVLVNLLENARAAIEEQGTVRIEASAVEEGVVLSVVDDGSGIPPELLPRIFEPHFSTRSSGTGLGLAIVRRIVESWDAIVSVESQTGVGTSVHISLRPWSENGASPPGAA